MFYQNPGDRKLKLTTPSPKVQPISPKLSNCWTISLMSNNSIPCIYNHLHTPSLWPTSCIYLTSPFRDYCQAVREGRIARAESNSQTLWWWCRSALQAKPLVGASAGEGPASAHNYAHTQPIVILFIITVSNLLPLITPQQIGINKLITYKIKGL